jgi:hypothetical protein
MKKSIQIANNIIPSLYFANILLTRLTIDSNLGTHNIASKFASEMEQREEKN